MQKLLFRRRQNDKGAALVEFGLIALPLFALVFAIIEFGWAFYQINSVRHGANEALRIAVTNQDPGGSGATQADRIAKEACSRMQDGGKNAKITITVGAQKDVGEEVSVVVSKPLDQLTNFYNPILKNITLSEDLEGRLEQSATYSSVTNFAC